MSDTGCSLTIREFDFTRDWTAVLELWTHAGSGICLGRSDEPQEIQKKLIRDPDLFLVAEVGEELIGSVIGGFDGRRGMIYHLAVKAAYRLQGIGEKLMDEVESRMREKGCLKSYLLVTGENSGAMRFYEKNGWERMQIQIYGKYLR